MYDIHVLLVQGRLCQFWRVRRNANVPSAQALAFIRNALDPSGIQDTNLKCSLKTLSSMEEEGPRCPRRPSCAEEQNRKRVASLSSHHHHRSHQAPAVAPHIEPPYICRLLGSWHRCEPVDTAKLLGGTAARLENRSFANVCSRLWPPPSTSTARSSRSSLRRDVKRLRVRCACMLILEGGEGH
jgi:hypothetical protein